MPNPKRRHSKNRARLRRGHHKVEVKNVMNCSNCGASVLSHHVCPECGYYKGKLAIEKKAVS